MYTKEYKVYKDMPANTNWEELAKEAGLTEDEIYFFFGAPVKYIYKKRSKDELDNIRKNLDRPEEELPF